MNCKRSYLFFLFVLTGLFATSQNVVTDTSATAIAYWKKGDKKIFDLKKTTEKKTKDKHQKDSATFQLTITVLEETKEYYNLEWRYKATDLPESLNNEFPGVEVLCNNLRLVYRTDANGSFMELINLDEVIAFVHSSFDLLLKEQNLTAGYKKVLEEFRKTLTSRESVENFLLLEVQLFHSIYGLEFNARKQTESVELFNVFGGDPFPAESDYQFVGYDKTKKLISLNIDTDVDSDAATKIIIDFLNATAKKAGSKDTIASGDIQNLNIKDTYRYTLEQPSGWIRSALSIRLVDVMGSYKKESTSIISK